ncbi:MAG: methyltransferase domain-containing protein [Gemmatimonadaceae bacterium]|nr:methyltransferase domain-containing protein [Gemmatimonadaceae bacterium]
MTSSILTDGEPSRARVAATVARHYDELDAFYRDVWGEHVHHGLWRDGDESPLEAAEQLVDHVVTAVSLQRGDRVIDVGAGYGGTARRLAARFGARVTGFTVSAAQHAYAQRLYGVADDGDAAGGARLLLGDWLTNALPSGEADVVIAIESTEHMADLSHALGEMHRVLRPGGQVAVCAWLAANAPAAWERRWLLEPLAREGRLVTLTTASAYASLLEEAGFADLTFEDLSAGVARTWAVCLRRLALRAVTDPRYLRYAFGDGASERPFLASMLRIAVAYARGAMRYGLFTARRRP